MKFTQETFPKKEVLNNIEYRIWIPKWSGKTFSPCRQCGIDMNLANDVVQTKKIRCNFSFYENPEENNILQFTHLLCILIILHLDLFRKLIQTKKKNVLLSFFFPSSSLPQFCPFETWNVNLHFSIRRVSFMRGIFNVVTRPAYTFRRNH